MDAHVRGRPRLFVRRDSTRTRSPCPCADVCVRLCHGIVRRQRICGEQLSASHGIGSTRGVRCMWCTDAPLPSQPRRSRALVQREEGVRLRKRERRPAGE